MNKRIALFVVCLLFLLSVGFASVATNLIAGGEATIGAFAPNSFDVYFSSASCGTDCTATIDQVDQRTLTITTPLLSSTNDTVTLNYTVKNDSSQYDTDVSMIYTIPNNSDVSIQKTKFLDNQLVRIEGKKSENGSLVITVTDTPSEPFTLTITLELELTAISRTSTAVNLDEADPADTPAFGYDSSEEQFAVSGNAKLDLGEATNIRLKKIAALANGASQNAVNNYTVNNTTDTYITAIVWSDNPPSQSQIVEYGQLGMTADSPLGVDTDGTTNELITTEVPIYAWYDNGTIYIWSSDSTIDMHPHSERMFEGMTNLTNISALSHFDSSKVETARYMFKNTSITSFTTTNNWDLTLVKASFDNIEQNLPQNNGFYQICNNIPNNVHMTISSPIGTWNNDGTYLPRDLRYYADLNGDGHVTQADYDAINNYMLGITVSINCTYEELCGDVDGNNSVNAADRNIIQKLIET